MKHLRIVTAISAIIACLALISATAQAEPPLNPRIHFAYVEPDAAEGLAKYGALRERLMKRKILEEYSRFLSPLRLKHDLTVRLEDCGPKVGVNSYYDSETYTIHICYEYLAFIENEAAVPHDKLPPWLDPPGAGLMPRFTRPEVIIGGLVDVLLHETGHAVFHIQDVPRLGHEEDAADEIANFMALQFGTSTALIMIKGAANVNHEMGVQLKFRKIAMADAHSLDAQRFANVICLAYGSPEGEAFKELADQYLPDTRKPNCKFEYDQAKRAFDATILPDVDQDLMRQVQGMQILTASDANL
jgi:hypothetical protein